MSTPLSPVEKARARLEKLKKDAASYESQMNELLNKIKNNPSYALSNNELARIFFTQLQKDVAKIKSACDALDLESENGITSQKIKKLETACTHAIENYNIHNKRLESIMEAHKKLEDEEVPDRAMRESMRESIENAEIRFEFEKVKLKASRIISAIVSTVLSWFKSSSKELEENMALQSIKKEEKGAKGKAKKATGQIEKGWNAAVGVAELLSDLDTGLQTKAVSTITPILTALKESGENLEKKLKPLEQNVEQQVKVVERDTARQTQNAKEKERKEQEKQAKREKKQEEEQKKKQQAIREKSKKKREEIREKYFGKKK